MADCRECNTFDTCIEVKGYQEGAIVGGYCINFTPKPAEPEKVKKTCKTCAVSSFNNGGVVCANFTCIISDNHTKWQPIPKPAEKIQQDYNARMDKVIIDSFTEAMNKPKLKPAEKFKTKINFSAAELAPHLAAEMAEYQMREAMRGSGLGGSILYGPISAETDKPKPPKKAKEKTMFRFSFRRYVMLCTAIVTTKIAIWLNPLVCQLWRLFPIRESRGGWDGLKGGEQAMISWFFTIVSIIIIVAAIYGFNKLTAYTFRKLEK